MRFVWEVRKSDIDRIADFVKTHNNQYVERVFDRNINHKNIVISKDSLLQAMFLSLLSSSTDSYPQEKVDAMLNKNPDLLKYQYLLKAGNIKSRMEEIFTKNGITKNIKKVPGYFSNNFDFLNKTGWDLEHDINNALNNELTKHQERELADKVDQGFKGFGSKEARSFLLMLGVTRYEIPIDYRLIDWLGNFGFPVRFTKTALQDKLFYHFVSDGIQLLCEKAGIFPCVLYTSVLSGSGNVK
jgi:thermostable 8-oxoguanine DNA glycosylase